MKPVEVSPDELRQAVEGLGGVTQGADGLLQGFASQVQSQGQPWGDDMLGMAIGVIYQTANTLVMDGLRSNLDTIDGLAQRLGVVADHYDGTDEDVAQRLSTISEPGTRI